MNKKPVVIPFHLKRVNYPAGMVLTQDDFLAEQQYFRDRLNLHNCYLHGHGIVAGLDVSLSNNVLKVSAGYAIDPQGNDVILPVDQLGPFPATGASAYLVLHWAERETDLLPSLNSNDEGESMMASRMEEYGMLEYETNKSKASQTGVVLARLKKIRGKWKVDKQFHAHRVRT